MKELHLTDYLVFPSVVPVGKPVTVSILPRGDNTYLPDGYEYTLDIFGVATATSELNKCKSKKLVLHAKNGGLTFTETFDREQKYVLKLTLPEELRFCSNPYYQPPAHGRVPRPGDIARPMMYLYALEEDLYPMRVFKGDFHLHSSDSDGHESSCGVMANLRKAGYDFAAMTNHYWFHTAEKVNRIFAGVEDIIRILPAEEVHTPTEFVHVVGVGQSRSVNDWYYQNRQICDAEIAQIEQSLPELPEGINRYNYACRVWTAQTIRKFGGLSILAHPHWIWNDVYFMPEDVTVSLMESGIYDAFELLNGDCGAETNRLQTALYFEEQKKGFDMPIVGSSDCHRTDREDEDFPTPAFTLVFCEDRSFESIRRAILERRCVAVEKYRDDSQYRLYGPYRMVKYADFLMQNYYPYYTELCRAQGTMLRSYETEPSKELASLLRTMYGQSEAYYRHFFGRD